MPESGGERAYSLDILGERPRSCCVMTRTDTPPAWDERTQLFTFLDHARDTAHAKCEGAAPEDARRAPLPGLR